TYVRTGCAVMWVNPVAQLGGGNDWDVDVEDLHIGIGTAGTVVHARVYQGYRAGVRLFAGTHTQFRHSQTAAQSTDVCTSAMGGFNSICPGGMRLPAFQTGCEVRAAASRNGDAVRPYRYRLYPSARTDH